MLEKKIKKLVGQGKKKKEYKWEIIADHTCEPIAEYNYVGLRGLRNLESETVCSDAYFHLCPVPVSQQLRNINAWIDLDNKERKLNSKKTIRLVTEREVAMGHAIFLAGAGYAENGEDLWTSPDKQDYKQLPPPPNFYAIFGISFNRFKEAIKAYWAKSFMHPDQFDANDPWGPVRPAINSYNENRRNNVAASVNKCGDESISEFKPRATKTADLPNIHQNQDKPKDMGSENNTVCCGKTGTMIFIDLNEGKEGNVGKDFNEQLGKAGGLTARMIDGTTGCGQSEEKTWICFNAKFALMSSLKWMAENGHEGILNIKQYHHGFPKAEFCKYISD